MFLFRYVYVQVHEHVHVVELQVLPFFPIEPTKCCMCRCHELTRQSKGRERTELEARQGVLEAYWIRFLGAVREHQTLVLE